VLSASDAQWTRYPHVRHRLRRTRATIRFGKSSGNRSYRSLRDGFSFSDALQAINCLATIIQSLRDEAPAVAGRARFSPTRRFALSPARHFAHSPKAVPFPANIDSTFGTRNGDPRPPILSYKKILHHEFLLEKRLNLEGDFEHKKRRGITAA
jgi:hypothetical protein